MKRFHLTVYRLYFAIAALIAVFLIQRPIINTQWDARTALYAGVSDLLLLILLAGMHRAVDRLAGRESLPFRISQAFHYALAGLLLVIVVFSQVLFAKTGETLDFAIIEFGIRHAEELRGVASGELNGQAVQPMATAVVFLLLVGVNLSRVVAVLARATLVLPILLLPACEIADGFVRAEAAALTIPGRPDALYQGSYANLVERDHSWNASTRDRWAMGILTGMFVGSAYGRLEFEAYSREAGAERIYDAPVVGAIEPGSRPNVLMIVLESVRFDALGIYRTSDAPANSPTPFIDRYARASRVVDRAYTTIPHTSKALVGIYCGTFPRFDAEIIEGLPGGLGIPCLPRLLSQAGYRSAHFQTAPAAFENRDQLLMNMGFDHYTTQESFASEPWERFAYLGMDDRAMVKPAVRWMQQQRRAGRPFFASLLTVTTHHPYVSPGNVKPVSNPAEAHAAYLTGLKYTDKVVEELFGDLEREGLLDNTLVIITGDHGEGFAEHGAVAHNGTAYEEGMRVPLIVREPGSTSREPIHGLRQHIDLLPTILEVARIPVSGRLPGRSLFSDPNGHAALVTSCFYEDYCLTHVDDSNRKLIYFHGRRGIELYDLNADPLERDSLLGAGAEAKGRVEAKMLSAVRLRNAYAAVWQ